MGSESRPSALKKHKLPEKQRRKTGREIFWYGLVGSVASTALLTGAMYGADFLTTHITDGVNTALNWAALPSGLRIPNLAEAGINALGGAINSIPHADVLPHFAAEHFSSVSSNPNFWGIAEGIGAVAGGTRGLILGYEIAKRQAKHSVGVVGESILPGGARLKKSADSAHSLVKTGDLLLKTTEVGTSFLTPGSPIGINDLFALAFILTGYRPGKGIMTAADLIGMSVLLATPFPTVTTWDFLKGLTNGAKSAPKHMRTIRDHARSIK